MRPHNKKNYCTILKKYFINMKDIFCNFIFKFFCSKYIWYLEIDRIVRRWNRDFEWENIKMPFFFQNRKSEYFKANFFLSFLLLNHHTAASHWQETHASTVLFPSPGECTAAMVTILYSFVPTISSFGQPIKLRLHHTARIFDPRILRGFS